MLPSTLSARQQGKRPVNTSNPPAEQRPSTVASLRDVAYIAPYLEPPLYPSNLDAPEPTEAEVTLPPMHDHESRAYRIYQALTHDVPVNLPSITYPAPTSNLYQPNIGQSSTNPNTGSNIPLAASGSDQTPRPSHQQPAAPTSAERSVCDLCGQPVDYKTPEWNAHLMMHVQRDNHMYKCPYAICGTRFMLAEHIATHFGRTHPQGAVTPQRPEPICKLCHRPHGQGATNYRNHLMTHVHTRSKVHRCPYRRCAQGFTSTLALVAHVRESHDPDAP